MLLGACRGFRLEVLLVSMRRSAQLAPEQDSKIRQMRRERGLSLRAAASQADMSFNHLSRVERGLGSLSVSKMLRLAKVLKVNSEWLAEQLGAIEDQRAES